MNGRCGALEPQTLRSIEMELYGAMRSAFSAREFTDEDIPDAVLYRFLENARFAPSGGNRQGWHVIVVRDPETKQALSDLAAIGARRYAAQIRAGESPWNPVLQPTPGPEAIAATPAPRSLTQPVVDAPVTLVVCVDLRLVAATDQHLDRIGIVGGASVYPFVWNILMAARAEGYGGVLTTIAIAQEPKLRALFALPGTFAVAAVLPLGRPARPLRRLSRKPVREFVTRDRWDGVPFEGPWAPS
jgi:nitroreductase